MPWRLDPSVYRFATTAQVTGWLRAAGFSDVNAHERPDVAPAVAFVTAVIPSRQPGHSRAPEAVEPSR